MKFEMRLIDLGGREQLAGYSLGERLFEERIEPALEGAAEETLLLLSFRGVEFVTGSFIKATWHRLHPPEGVRVPSMLAHLNEDVRTEFAIYVRSERLAGLEAVDWMASKVKLAALHGELEDPAMRALTAISAAPGSTAPQLQASSPERVTPTAWTNRLNELHRQGLAFRQKAGRAWKFFPLAEEVRRG